MDNKEKLYAVQYCGDEPTAGHIELWTMAQILDEINRDRSADWTPYVKRDWKEGLTEWTSYRPYDMRKLKGKRFVVFAVRMEKGRAERIRKAEKFTIEEARKVAEFLNTLSWTIPNDYPFKVYPCAE